MLSEIYTSDIAAILGMILGTAGLVLGILNHFRDRAKIIVILKWDMRFTDNPVYNSRKSWAIISVANLGRRPIFISKAAIYLPKKYKARFIIAHESLKGKKLNEGDPELTYILSQDGFEEYAKDWKKIRAIVYDCAGKKYYSKPNVNQVPSWAKRD